MQPSPSPFPDVIEDPTPKALRAAQLAHVLASAVRNDECDARDVLRVLRHELRRLNTRGAERAPQRSEAAQAVIDKYGDDRPRNGSSEALHSDHVYGLSLDQLENVMSVKAWVTELVKLQEVVCVTAEENYRLMRVEKEGTWGPEKYDAAGIRLVAPADVDRGTNMSTD